MTEGKRVYFMSDMHLGAGYIPDARAHEHRVIDFLKHIAPDAEALYLMGDVLDYWFEYRNVVPRGHVRFFGQLASMADAGIRITWFTGNHDIWMFDYLRDELGIRVIETPASGGIEERIGDRVFYIGHGDTFGSQPGSYKVLRSIFHNHLCQRLYAAIHPRWTIPFAHGWSSHSRKGYERAAHPELTPQARQNLETAAKEFAAAHPEVNYILMGHHHVPMDLSVGPDCRLIVLGDWISQDSYAVFDGQNLTMENYGKQSNG